MNLEPHGGQLPVVLTHPAAQPDQVQPTLGRIMMGVFLGNLMTGLVVAVIWVIVYAAS